ncbi:MAG: helix-turn-helix domain-containing protein [Lentisphaerae bacterium]|nr:helix-turn-helix domain-containing protein [Lentisphaerota bacterium]
MSEHGEPIDVMGSAYMFYLASGHSPGAVNQVKKEMTLGHRHWHDFHELTVVLDGCGTYEYQGKIYSINPGDTFITPPGEIHHYSNQKNLSLMNFVWYPEQLPISMDKLNNIPGFRAFFKLEPQSRSLFKFAHCMVLSPEQIYVMQTFYHRIEEELLKKNDRLQIYIGLLFVELLITVCRFYQESQKNAKQLNNELQKMNDVLDFLHANIANPLTRAQAARVFGSSESNFSRIFTRIMQESYSDYLVNLRLQHAKNMLMNTNKTLSEISAECGFCDSNYLCFRFRKKFGLSPHQFRMKNNPYFG